MPRGGLRIAGPGKKLGRPKKVENPLLSERFAQKGLETRLRRCGITQEDFDALLRQQKGRCAICAELLTAGWVLDHDHMTLRNRGLIHHACNSLLGLAKDDPLRLERAAAYLRKRNEFLRCRAEDRDLGPVGKSRNDLPTPMLLSEC